MTETMGTTSGGTPPNTDTSTRDVAKEEARGVAQDAVQGGRQAAETAKEQAGQVADEALSQARMLIDQTREQITTQGSAQQERAATGLRSLADELSGMASGTDQGIAADLAREASARVRTAADWLENRQPGEVLDDVRSFARRRPGMFLLGAAAIGFVGGRMTRGLAAEARDDSPRAIRSDVGSATPSTPSTSPTSPLSTGVAEAAPVGPGYSVPPTTADPAGDATAQFTPTAPGAGFDQGANTTDQMPSELGARGTGASGNRTEGGA